MAASQADGALPPDALVVKSILQSMGVKEYDPRVVHQLLDFMYRNVSDVLQVAETFNERAGSTKQEIGLDDVMLAIQAKAATSFVAPPSQQVVRSMAERRNSVALPAVATKYGFRLPPAQDCLIAPNVQFHPRDAPANMGWEGEPFATGPGEEPFAAPPGVPVRNDVQPQKQHPAFQDLDQHSSEADAAAAASHHQTAQNMEAG